MSNQMTKEDAARIQSGHARSGSDPGFAQRAQSAADKNQSQAAQGSKSQSGGQAGGQTGGQGGNQSAPSKR